MVEFLVKHKLINASQHGFLKARSIFVLSGVQQGSGLGPILFLIYTHNLEDDISSKVLEFADDTKVLNNLQMTQKY